MKTLPTITTVVILMTIMLALVLCASSCGTELHLYPDGTYSLHGTLPKAEEVQPEK